MVALAYGIVAAGVSIAIHTIPIEHAENDQYLSALESFLRGERCYDQFHPTHTVLAGAAIVTATGCDAFTALRLVAALGGSLVLFAVHRSAAILGTNVSAWLATSLVLLHPGLFLLSLQASSDALGTGLSMTALWSAVRLQRSGRPTDAALCGLALGLAVGTRFSAVAFAPALLAIFAYRDKGRSILAGTLGLCIGYAPHAVVSTWWTGSPVHSLNWRNLVLKHGDFDPRLLIEPGFANVFDFLSRHGVDLLELGLVDLWQQLTGGLGRLMVGGPTTWPAVVAVGVLVAHAGAVLRLHRGCLVAVCSAVYLVFICMTFAPAERFLLPVVATSAVLLSILTTSRPALLRAVGVVCIAFVLVHQLNALPRRLGEFIDAHPFAEIEAGRDLARRSDVERLGSTYANLHRFVPGAVYVSPGPHRALEQPVAHLRRQAVVSGATTVLVGRRTAPALYARLREVVLPPDVEVLANDDDLFAVRLDLVSEDGRDGIRWISDFSVAPAVWREGPLSILVTLTDDIDVQRVAAVSIKLELTPGKGPVVDLVARDGRSWQLEWPLKPPPGSWMLQAMVRLDDGHYIRGPRREVTVQ